MQEQEKFIGRNRLTGFEHHDCWHYNWRPLQPKEKTPSWKANAKGESTKLSKINPKKESQDTGERLKDQNWSWNPWTQPSDPALQFEENSTNTSKASSYDIVQSQLEGQFFFQFDDLKFAKIVDGRWNPMFSEEIKAYE